MDVQARKPKNSDTGSLLSVMRLVCRVALPAQGAPDCFPLDSSYSSRFPLQPLDQPLELGLCAELLLLQ